MSNEPDGEFERFVGKARLQLLLLYWISNRLYERQNGGKPEIDAIEMDFKKCSEEIGQHVDFRFDRDDTMLMLARPLLVDGIESINRHSRVNEIKEMIECKLGNIDDLKSKFSISVELLTPFDSTGPATSWTLLNRLRNSLSHFRYKYSDDGLIKFKDRNRRGTETSDFSISLVKVLSLSYEFGCACCVAQQELSNESNRVGG